MTDLRGRWLAYLSCCNDRRLDDLGDHVHDEIVFNNQPVALNDYAAAIAGNLEAVPDFHWTVKDIVVADGTVAVRLTDTGTPTGTWLGIAPTGRSFTVAEWATYHYRDDKIASMHFLLDIPDAQQQLRPLSS